MKKYLLQQGIDGACIYWNKDGSSKINEKVDSSFNLNGFDYNEALELKQLWSKYANNSCVFKIIEVNI